MKLTPLARVALIGLLVSLYQIAVAAVPLVRGMFAQDWSRMELADVPLEVQSPRLIELLHAAHEASHSSAVAFGSVAQAANELAFTEFWASAASAVLFVVILGSEVRRNGGRA